MSLPFNLIQKVNHIKPWFILIEKSKRGGPKAREYMVNPTLSLMTSTSAFGSEFFLFAIA
jgi:hypothetical protein